MLKWRYQQHRKEGTVWTSEAVFTGEYRKAAQGVVAGFLIGEPRAAIEEETRRVIYAVDEKGQATAAAVTLFSTLDLATLNDRRT